MRPGSGPEHPAPETTAWRTPGKRRRTSSPWRRAAIAAVMAGVAVAGCSGGGSDNPSRDAGASASSPVAGSTPAGSDAPQAPSDAPAAPSDTASVLPGGDSPPGAPVPAPGGQTLAPAAAAVQAPSAVVAVGTAVPVTAVDGSRAEVTLLSAESSPTSRAASAETPAAGRFLYVTVRIAATGGPFSANPLDFSVRSGEALTDYSTGNGIFALDEGALLPQDVPAGDSVTGTIAFDLPPGPAQLQYAPGDTDQALAGWDIPG